MAESGASAGDVAETAPRRPREGIVLLSRGRWRHRAVRLGPTLLHVDELAAVRRKRAAQRVALVDDEPPSASVARRFMHKFIEAKLQDVLAQNPPATALHVDSDDEAQYLAYLAEGHGLGAVVRVLELLGPDDAAVARFALEGLARLMVPAAAGAAPPTCSRQDVLARGGCDIVTAALSSHAAHSMDAGGAALWCMALLAEHSPASRRLLELRAGARVLDVLRPLARPAPGAPAACHVFAQTWGVACLALFARNAAHRHVLLAHGLCDALPGLLANHQDALLDRQLQIRGLECLQELLGADAALCQPLIDAGVVAALDQAARAQTQAAAAEEQERLDRLDKELWFSQDEQRHAALRRDERDLLGRLATNVRAELGAGCGTLPLPTATLFSPGAGRELVAGVRS